MKTFGTIVLGSAGLLAIVGLLLSILAAALSAAWNFVVPKTFGYKEIDFAGAFALLVILLIVRIILSASTSKTSTDK